MRKLITGLVILIAVASFGQNKNVIIEKNIDGKATVVDGDTKVEAMSISVTVDSEEEVKSAFTNEGIEEILEMVKDGEEISFKIICNGEKMANGLKPNISYSIKGNSNNKKDFLKGIQNIKTRAIKYYKSK